MITTYTGKAFSFIDPQPEDICIEDIAHHLSLICRFNGACRVFYSVAQHSVHVSEQVPSILMRQQALLHDAGETYYGDITSPFKKIIKEIEFDTFELILKRIDKAIFEKFNVPYPIDIEIKQADKIMFGVEWINFMSEDMSRTSQGAMVPWSSELAEATFLKKCREVGIR